MTIDISSELSDEEYATARSSATSPPAAPAGHGTRARTSSDSGGGGDRPEIAFTFTAEDLLAVSMLSVRIDGYHALDVLHYQARELNGLLAAIPPASP